MRCAVLLLLMLLSRVAIAETEVDAYLRTARTMARDGNCAGIPAVSKRLLEIAPLFHAEHFVTDPEIARCTPRRPVEMPAIDQRSEGTALGLSIGTTLAGVAALSIAAAMDGHREQGTLALLGLGLVTIGPTTGHIYAGNTWNRGLQVRLVSLAVTALSLTVAFHYCAPFNGCTADDRRTAESFDIIALVGGITYLGASVYEMGSAGRSVRKRNELRIVPTGLGVGAVGRF